MANEKRLIDANALTNEIIFVNKCLASEDKAGEWTNGYRSGLLASLEEIYQQPTVDAVEVVRCQNCVHAEPLDHNCELSTSFYLHCKLWRGEETKNVWHKYKKYYKDYSLVERDGYCDAGAKMD